MFTPFLFELRTVIDWMFTDTSLLFSEWVRVESIYAQVFDIKCKRLRNYHEHLSGQKFPRWNKYLIGGLLTLFLLTILWFPLILFAVSPSLGVPNIPDEVTMTLQLENYEILFKAQATKSNIYPFSRVAWQSILSMYEKNPAAKIFLREFEAADVVAVNLNIVSSSTWNVPQINIDKMIDELRTGKPKNMRLSYKFSRDQSRDERDTILHSTEVVLDKTGCDNLASMLEGSNTETKIYQIFPKLINIQRNRKSKTIPQLLTNFPECKLYK